MDSRPSAFRSAETIAAARDVGGSPTPWRRTACRALLDQLDLDLRHVEGRRQQVVGERGVRDLAVPQLDLLHQREAEPLSRATLDLADHALRVDREPDVLRRRELHHPHQAELLVHVDHGPLCAEQETDDVAVRVRRAEDHRMPPHACAFDRLKQFLHRRHALIGGRSS
jgi:hypothetical protein